jgi:hypothetical protein
VEEVREWIEAQGIGIRGAIENIHQRPWSCILRVPGNSGTLYFKATAGLAAHEIGFTAFLSKLVPQHTPQASSP